MEINRQHEHVSVTKIIKIPISYRKHKGESKNRPSSDILPLKIKGKYFSNIIGRNNTFFKKNK
jgi:hypothetical protein